MSDKTHLTKAVHINLTSKEGEKVWKKANGDLVPLSQLTVDELIVYRKIAMRNSKKHYDLFTMFSGLVEDMDELIHNNISKLQEAEKE
jgi:hypothetical protein